jgi:tetratricopeptide (TPR) repeat protein
VREPTGLAAQFASENWSGICPEAWVALSEANTGHAPAYGGDDWTAAAVNAIRELFDTECEVFFVFTGTAANSLGLAAMARKRGDSTSMRNTIEEAFRYIPSPSNLLLVFMVYAGNEMGSRFIAMTPEQIHIETLPDSIGTYYDNKADYFLGRGDLGRAKVYYDSIITKLDGRNLAGPAEPSIRLFLANAYAFNNRLPDAVREVNRATAAARALKDFRPDGSLYLNGRILAAVYGKLGRYDDAIREARALLKNDSWTRPGLAREPKLRGLRGNPAYEAFLREPESK